VVVVGLTGVSVGGSMLTSRGISAWNSSTAVAAVRKAVATDS